MNHDDLISFYEKRISKYTTLLTSKTKKINLVSNLRLFTALVFLVLIYIAFSDTIFIYAAFPVLIIFAVLVQQHSKLFNQKVHLENLLKINGQETQALHGDTSCFISGSEFIDPHHPYSHDLDIFGDGSLFQSINRCNTIHGKKEMAQRLSGPLTSAEEIKSYQQAIQELADKTDFRQHYQAAGMEIEEQPLDHEQLLAWLKLPAFVYTKSFFTIFLFVLPAITISFIIATFFLSIGKPIAILLAILQ
jgi:hypothetical protein